MIEIKKTGIESIPVISALAKKIWPVAYKYMISEEQIEYMLWMMYSDKSLEHQISALHHQFIIAYDTDKTEAVGFASYSKKENDTENTYRLHKLYICIECQGRGIGKSLLNYIIHETSLLGADQLELNVNKRNKAFDFYIKNGFHILRKEKLDIGHGYYMDDYVMVFQLAK